MLSPSTRAHGSPAMKSSPMVKACARPSGLGLLGVGEVHAVARAVPEQALEVGQVGRRGDDQDVADARQHEGGQRVVDHGLVVDRQQLLGGHERAAVQAGAGPAGEDDVPFIT